MTVARLLTALLVCDNDATFDVPHVASSSGGANDIVTVIDSIFRN